MLRGVRGGELLVAALLVAGLTAIDLAGGGGGTPTDSYSIDDYRSGGYAAFFTLLQREGVAVESFNHRPNALDRRIDTLIVAYPPVVARAGPAPHVQIDRPFGRGRLVVESDPQRFDNAGIGRDGNARRAYALGRPLHPGGIVAFDESVHGALIERTWWQAIDEPQRVALGGIALALLVALIGGLLRLGPALTLAEAREPASDEFVAAAASLYQRSGARRAAIALLAHAARTAPGAAAVQLRALAERQSPSDRDVIVSAQLARRVREGA